MRALPKIFTTGLAVCLWSGSAAADPCGMVPPIWSANVPQAITRVGPQQTYAFYENGMETFVIRPAFSGKIDEFGMLIPFPTPPAIRKVPDEVFTQIANAIDPPEVQLYLSRPHRRFRSMDMAPSAARSAAEAPLKVDEVRVIKQEAVGMYEVAVLEAGSAKALSRWMEDHKYSYPAGMDATTEEYVKAGWCFAAVKSRVGAKAGVDPKPGMREAEARLPPGGTWNGAVQAMGFRFFSKEFVVPMRLSAFNEGELRNVMYLLSSDPLKVRQLPPEVVRRQVKGSRLYRNMTGPLPVRIIGGQMKDVKREHLERLAEQRDPKPKNAVAKELFASDLRAVTDRELTHAHEESEKVLLRIGEELGLRGAQIDALNQEELEKQKKVIYAGTRQRLRRMTMTVVDGTFPRDLLGRENLKFEKYQLPQSRNSVAQYDAKFMAPGQAQDPSTVFWGTPKHLQREEKTRWWEFW